MFEQDLKIGDIYRNPGLHYFWMVVSDSSSQLLYRGSYSAEDLVRTEIICGRTSGKTVVEFWDVESFLQEANASALPKWTNKYITQFDYEYI